MHGGKRPGAGRKPGVPSKVTAARREAMRIVADEVRTEGETPLEYMLRVMRNGQADEKRRDMMAVAAAPFLHPKLAAVEHSGDKDNPVHMTVQNADADTFAGRVVSLASREDTGAGDSFAEH